MNLDCCSSSRLCCRPVTRISRAPDQVEACRATVVKMLRVEDLASTRSCSWTITAVG
ncbi:hypothetical protein EV643_104224 [Kribbella sp. VKM Ac-2527]|uniref:Uncharacterized protein n=1 Tax=Kribbella caucasensis TaxID=2512215 RepID=A0A4R6KI21_9ACTN|nr:hypothetical protein [Kribbella sp. VKM Ac-2527]TDO50730.1 hypothetical protein EV643_104224 [Kribbella sp. VKM Ac-2527]